MPRRFIAILLASILAAGSFALATAGSSAAAKSPLYTCYFIVKIPTGSTAATLGPKLKQRISKCADEMQDGSIRAAIRLGRSPTTIERAWQKAVIDEFVRNDCAVVSDVATSGCEIFPEQWPYAFAGKIAKPGTVIVFGFEPI